MKVLVCGSRKWSDPDAVADRLADLAPDYPVVIHGGAIGADRMAHYAAKLYGYEVQVFEPDYDRWPPRVAPLKRNLQMLDESPDLVIAFQRGGSGGTQHTIDEARKRGIPVEVHTR